MQFRESASGRGNLLAVSIVLASGLWLGGCNSSKSAPPPPVAEVATVTVQTERIVLTTDLPGRTSAYSMAEIRPQVSGIIQQRLFEEGAEIKVGQVLYQIDPAPLQAAYDNAAANLAATRRAAERARASLAVSRAGVVRQRAVLENARTNKKRFVDLFGEGAIAASERDQAVTEADVAEATLLSTEAQVESDREAVAAAEAAIRQAEAALQSARINLGYARVTAPIGGRIGKSMVTVGALATAGQATPLAAIQQLDPIYVDVTESSANLLRLKQHLASGRLKGNGPQQASVKLLLEDGTLYPLEGRLKFSDVTVDPSTGSFILRTLFPNPRRMLLPGMYVRAIIQEGVVDQAILVPQQSVSRDPKGNPVALIVDSSEKVVQRKIAVDRAIGDRWLVSEGLVPGDRLIVEGVQRVRPGTSVKAIAFEAGQQPNSDAVKPVQPAAGPH
ncbi:MAG TPA: efflux RND transporter periplasmic adaptor subunit [Candidatus Methylomirabilis sp.]|nr:efflux RND transporter periplasmic adaptor subunit [Candidatus Methylomirabilis sp.]